MTEQQIEIAAREYCRRTGVNPDDDIGQSVPAVHEGKMVMQKMSCPRWRAVAETMAHTDLVYQCLAYAQAQPAPVLEVVPDPAP